MQAVSFADISIVACGTMSLELNQLKREGLLDTPQILYTTPGLHQDIPELERQLVSGSPRPRRQPQRLSSFTAASFAMSTWMRLRASCRP
jgi:hypothetical protein